MEAREKSVRNMTIAGLVFGWACQYLSLSSPFLLNLAGTGHSATSSLYRIWFL
jgi:hypothetical protein